MNAEYLSISSDDTVDLHKTPLRLLNSAEGFSGLNLHVEIAHPSILSTNRDQNDSSLYCSKFCLQTFDDLQCRLEKPEYTESLSILESRGTFGSLSHFESFAHYGLNYSAKGLDNYES